MSTDNVARRSIGHAVRFEEVGAATDRLLEVARSDTGQSRRVADFLLAWWNGDDQGHFPIQHLWNVDRTLSGDMMTIMTYLSQQPSAVYADAFGYGEAMVGLVHQWRDVPGSGDEPEWEKTR